MSEGFAFILNRLTYEGQIPFEVIPGTSFAPATDAQKRIIAHFLTTYGNPGRIGGIHNYVRRDPDPNIPPPSLSKLTANDVEFWVLNVTSVFGFLTDLEIPFLLAEPELEWSTHFREGGTGGSIPQAFHFYQSTLNTPPSAITEATFKDVASIHANMAALKCRDSKAAESLTRILTDFKTSRSYIRLGHMALLSHFRFIEALVTHEPSATAGDSLTHQVSAKIPLLFRRFPTPLASADFFDLEDQTKTWKLLYEVRSCYAHGSVADFKTGRLASLRNFSSVERFVYLSLKALLRQALIEPELVFDLKAC